MALWAPRRHPNYRWSPQMATRPNPCVRICVSVSQLPSQCFGVGPSAGRGWLQRPSSFLPAAWRKFIQKLCTVRRTTALQRLPVLLQHPVEGLAGGVRGRRPLSEFEAGIPVAEPALVHCTAAHPAGRIRARRVHGFCASMRLSSTFAGSGHRRAAVRMMSASTGLPGGCRPTGTGRLLAARSAAPVPRFMTRCTPCCTHEFGAICVVVVCLSVGVPVRDEETSNSCGMLFVRARSDVSSAFEPTANHAHLRRMVRDFAVVPCVCRAWFACL